MNGVLVPSSPSKAQPLADRLSQRYEKQRLDELYGPLSGSAEASASAMPGPSNEGRISSFFLNSANAKRTSDIHTTKKTKAVKRVETFQRSNNASLASKLRTKVRESVTKGAAKGGDDDSLRVVESIPIGPKKLTAPDDDLHFTRLEPSSGIALRRRMIPNPEVEAYLDGRYYVPISTLYAIAQAGKCDDGEFSVPLEGDWMTMGVLIKKSRAQQSKERHLDAMGRLIEEKSVKGKVQEPEPSIPKGKGEVVTGGGETKKLASKKWCVFTLLDISGAPNKVGGHSGANEIEMTVFEADSTWVEPGGVRKYAGGSGGAFEKLELAGLGALICVMNPRISNVKKWKDFTPWYPGKKPTNENVGDTSMIFRLKPRSGQTIQVIGMARDFGQCQVTDCEAFVDKRNERGVCQTHLLSNLNRTQNGRPQLQNSWKPYTNEYSLSDGMAMGSKAKEYVVDSHNDRPKMEGGQLYDVSSHYGRAKERRVVDAGQVEQLLSLKKRLTQSSTSKNPIVKAEATTEALSESRLAALVREKNQARAKGLAASRSMEEKMKHVMYESAGTQIIHAARMAMEKSGRLTQSTSVNLKRPLDDRGGAEEEAFSTIKMGGTKRLSQSSDRLLARHSISSSRLPKPVLHRKKAKLAPTVRPPSGESFYASESSDEELDAIMQGDEIASHLQSGSQAGGEKGAVGWGGGSDSESDLEIMPRSR